LFPDPTNFISRLFQQNCALVQRLFSFDFCKYNKSLLHSNWRRNDWEKPLFIRTTEKQQQQQQQQQQNTDGKNKFFCPQANSG